MSIDIIIDKLTDCLVLRETNTVVKTEYKKLDTSINTNHICLFDYLFISS